MAEMFEGGCSCGAVRYRLTSRPMFTHCCHCLDCQKQTGGAFVINALIETARIEMLSGAPRKVEMPSPSGRGGKKRTTGLPGPPLAPSLPAMRQAIIGRLFMRLVPPVQCPHCQRYFRPPPDIKVPR